MTRITSSSNVVVAISVASRYGTGIDLIGPSTHMQLSVNYVSGQRTMGHDVDGRYF